MFCEKDRETLLKWFDRNTVWFFTDNKESHAKLKSRHKNEEYFELKVSIISKGGFFGLKEWFLGWPYRITSVRCISKGGTLLCIDKDPLLHCCRHETEELIQSVVKKIWLNLKGISAYAKWKNGEINPVYFKNSLMKYIRRNAPRERKSLMNATQNQNSATAKGQEDPQRKSASYSVTNSPVKEKVVFLKVTFHINWA